MVVQAAPRELLNKKWLLVALDSNRGQHLARSYEFLKKQLPSRVKLMDSGIAFDGSDLVSAVEIPGIIVPFSAAFVLDYSISQAPTAYNLTSESETLHNLVPDDLKDAFRKPGVHAYFADGCGLNYCLRNDSLEVFLSR